LYKSIWIGQAETSPLFLPPITCNNINMTAVLDGKGEKESPQLERGVEHDLPLGSRILAESEVEPHTPYQLGWKTILALLTLSMANVCAALSNTVRD
jgi:hypothetical protein